MNAEIYSEWLRRQGLQVLRTASSWWHSQVRGVLQAFPYHQLIQPSAGELRELMFGHHAVAVRYSRPPVSGHTATGYHVVYTASAYGFDVLSARPRKNVRRALRQCAIFPMSLEHYARESWPLRVDTLERQNRRVIESKREWQGCYNIAADLPGFEAWGAQIRGELAASLAVFHMDDWYYVVSQQSHRNYLRESVNNALTFWVTSELVSRPGVGGIFYGMQSLDAPPSVDEFKFHMGYEARPVEPRVEFHPWARPFVNRLTHSALRLAARLAPASYWPRKAEGVVRIFREGQGWLRSPAKEVLVDAASKKHPA